MGVKMELSGAIISMTSSNFFSSCIDADLSLFIFLYSVEDIICSMKFCLLMFVDVKFPNPSFNSVEVGYRLRSEPYVSIIKKYILRSCSGIRPVV